MHRQHWTIVTIVLLLLAVSRTSVRGEEVRTIQASHPHNSAHTATVSPRVKRLPPPPQYFAPRVALNFPIAPPDSTSDSQADSEDKYDSKEFKESVKKLSWSKGGFKIEPYGVIWGDLIYATRRTNPGPYVLYVLSKQEEGEDTFNLDVRRTRLGLHLNGPDIAGHLENRARVEIDFHGDFVTENRASLLLRQLYWEVGDDSFRLLFGQTEDVISPLWPGTLNYSINRFGGNIGFRRAQLRVERFFDFSNALLLTLQGSLNQDIVTDFRTEPGIRRETVDWPVLQGRVALTIGQRGEQCDPTTLGFSGHIGETGFDFLTAGPPPLNLPPEDDARFRTWSANIDLRMPLTRRCGLQGEIYYGENLSPFLGGIGQGVCPCLRVPIRDHGLWCEIWYHWTSRLHSSVGFGLDDPNDDDSLFGRTYNQFIYGNLVVDVTDELTTGLEVAHWKTLYHETRVGQIPAHLLTPSQPGTAIVVQWMIKYEF